MIPIFLCIRIGVALWFRESVLRRDDFVSIFILLLQHISFAELNIQCKTTEFQCATRKQQNRPNARECLHLSVYILQMAMMCDK